MKTRRPSARALGAAMLAAFLLCAEARAQAPEKSCIQLRAELAAVAPLRAVNRLSGDGCLGDRPDADPSTGRVQRLFDTAARVEGKDRATIKEVALSAEERRALTLAVLRVADEYLNTLLAAASAADAVEVTRLRTAVQQAIRARSEGVEPGDQSRVQRMSYWTWDGQPPSPSLGGTGIDVPAMLGRAGCNDTPRAPACAGAQATVEGLLRGARLAERAFTPDQAQAIQAAAARAAVRDARWRSYFADARSQYPWELYFNSRRYESTVRDKAGVSGPPEWQWIVLHPDIGMQYVRSAAPGDRFRPALVLELIGYNQWSWGGDNKPHNAWGASVVRTYADTASVPSGAWGVAIHRNNKYSVTFTRVDGRTGILLSVDLAGAATAASEEWSDRFRIGR